MKNRKTFIMLCLALLFHIIGMTKVFFQESYLVQSIIINQAEISRNFTGVLYLFVIMCLLCLAVLSKTLEAPTFNTICTVLSILSFLSYLIVLRGTYLNFISYKELTGDYNVPQAEIFQWLIWMQGEWWLGLCSLLVFSALLLDFTNKKFTLIKSSKYS